MKEQDDLCDEKSFAATGTVDSRSVGGDGLEL